jgi:hypothetical protein
MTRVSGASDCEHLTLQAFGACGSHLPIEIVGHSARNQDALFGRSSVSEFVNATTEACFELE